MLHRDERKPRDLAFGLERYQCGGVHVSEHLGFTHDRLCGLTARPLADTRTFQDDGASIAIAEPDRDEDLRHEALGEPLQKEKFAEAFGKGVHAWRLR